MNEYLKILISGKNLSSLQAKRAFLEIVKKETDPVIIGSFLTALTLKSVTAEEIVGFVEAMRQSMKTIIAKNAVDVCGTGGDGKKTFNISTAVAFVVAGAGISVAKHGNRAASSKSGSADVLEALGVNVNLTPEQAAFVLKKVGMVFLFAPLFHPSMKKVALVRKTLGFPTVFNYLGPFLNPGSVKRQVIGVSDKKILPVLTKAAKKLNYKKLVLVSSEDGMDEISPTVKTTCLVIEGDKAKKKILDPKKLGFAKLTGSLVGKDAKDSAEIILKVLDGELSIKRDVVVLNSGVSLFVSGRVKSIKEGLILSEKSIDSGAAKKVLSDLIKETNRYA